MVDSPLPIQPALPPFGTGKEKSWYEIVEIVTQGAQIATISAILKTKTHCSLNNNNNNKNQRKK